MNPEKTLPGQATPLDRAVLRQSQPQDYDGHTHFARMKPAERLAWLEGAVQFVAEVNGKLSPPRLDLRTDRNAAHG